MFLRKLLLATAVTTALAGAAVGIAGCGEEIHKHDFQWTTDKSATCTENGHETGTCSCGETRERSVAATGHSALSAVAAKDATCGNPGNIAYWTCSKCNQKFADEGGKRQVTDEEVTITVAHNLSTVNGKAATCTTEGMQTYYHCNNCDKNFTNADGTGEVADVNTLKIAPKHTPGELVAEKAATCTTPGIKAHYTCTVCQKNFEDQACATQLTDLRIDPKGHDKEKHDAKAATCTEAGNIEYWTCKTCNLAFADESCVATLTEADYTIPALGHKTVHTALVEASCDHTGTKEHYYCSVCEKRFSDAACTTEITDYVIPYSHEFATIEKEVVATCEKAGKKAHATCKICEKKFIVEGDGSAENPYVYTQYWDEDELITEVKTHKDFAVQHGKLKDDGSGFDEDFYKDPAHKATCSEPGWAFFWECTSCKKCFSDADCTKDAGFVMKTTDQDDQSQDDETKDNQNNGGSFRIVNGYAEIDALEEGGNDQTQTTDNGRPTEAQLKDGYDDTFGMAVKPLHHLAEVKPGTGVDGSEPVFFWHPTREGHYLICRRDCCDGAHIPGLKVEGRTAGDDESVVNSTTFGTLGKHVWQADENGIEHCSICGYGNMKDSEKPASEDTNHPKSYLDGVMTYTPSYGTNGNFGTWQEYYGVGDNKSYTLQDNEIILGDTGSGFLMSSYNANWAIGMYNVAGVFDLTQLTKNGQKQTVIAIGVNAFSGYQGINTVIIPWTVRYIDSQAFSGCSALEYVIFEEAPETIPEGKVAELYIGSGAFYNCPKLKSITFPAHLKGIDCNRKEGDTVGTYHAFNYTNLTEITFNSVVMDVEKNEAGNALEEKGNLLFLGSSSSVDNIYALFENTDNAGEEWKKEELLSGMKNGVKAYYMDKFDDEAVEYSETVKTAGTALIQTIAGGEDGDVEVTINPNAVKWIGRQYDSKSKTWKPIQVG